jgi:hypothetical protein
MHIIYALGQRRIKELTEHLVPLEKTQAKSIIERIEVLDKVKKLFLIPGMEVWIVF